MRMKAPSDPAFRRITYWKRGRRRDSSSAVKLVTRRVPVVGRAGRGTRMSSSNSLRMDNNSSACRGTTRSTLGWPEINQKGVRPCSFTDPSCRPRSMYGIPTRCSRRSCSSSSAARPASSPRPDVLDAVVSYRGRRHPRHAAGYRHRGVHASRGDRDSDRAAHQERAAERAGPRLQQHALLLAWPRGPHLVDWKGAYWAARYVNEGG